jgi:hypothetical protein
MKSFRKNILVYMIASFSVLGLLNVSVQFGRILDFFPGMNISLLLAEEITETEGSEKGNENILEVELFLTRDSYELHNLLVNDAVEVYLHSVDIPTHPSFEKTTPPPKA